MKSLEFRINKNKENKIDIYMSYKRKRIGHIYGELNLEDNFYSIDSFFVDKDIKEEGELKEKIIQKYINILKEDKRFFLVRVDLSIFNCENDFQLRQVKSLLKKFGFSNINPFTKENSTDYRFLDLKKKIDFY